MHFEIFTSVPIPSRHLKFQQLRRLPIRILEGKPTIMIKYAINIEKFPKIPLFSVFSLVLQQKIVLLIYELLLYTKLVLLLLIIKLGSRLLFVAVCYQPLGCSQLLITLTRGSELKPSTSHWQSDGSTFRSSARNSICKSYYLH